MLHGNKDHEWDHVGEIGRNAGECWTQKDAYEADQTSSDTRGRNVGYNEATRRFEVTFK